jgi:hypothetical protein
VIICDTDFPQTFTNNYWKDKKYLKYVKQLPFTHIISNKYVYGKKVEFMYE